MLRTIISIWRDFSSQMKKQNISAYASSTAFFLFLSVIPMLMVVCAVIPYTPVTEQNLITALTDVTPDIADAMWRVWSWMCIRVRLESCLWL